MKQKIWIILGIIIVIVEAILIIFSYRENIDNKDNKIPENYIVMFKGESGEVVYTTYVYEKKKGKKKKQYKYINTTTTYTEVSGFQAEEKITKKGTKKNMKKIIELAAKKCSYVIQKDGNIYTIEEFKEQYK